MRTASSISRARPGDLAAPQRLVPAQRFLELLADRHQRVQRGHRLLEDHPQALAAQRLQLPLGQAEQVAALEDDRPAGGRWRRAAAGP